MKKNEVVNEIFLTNEGYGIKIIDYINKENVLIQFVERSELQIWTTYQNIKNGQIKNPYHLSVYNKGYYGVGKYTARINNVKTPEYIKWFSMFVRCYDEKYLEKEPAYIGCEVGKEFLCFQNFANWYNAKIYDCEYPLELDKDLLYRGNKIYKPSTCCFIPKEINTTINSKRDDLHTMKYLYNKYSKHVPHYIRTKLYELATVGDKQEGEVHNELS